MALYNKDFTGEWGQDVEAALALADTTVNGVAIATEQTDSTVNYQDGASMDSTDFGALFQPASGPTLVTVDGFANPLGFTEEEAQISDSLLQQEELPRYRVRLAVVEWWESLCRWVKES